MKILLVTSHFHPENFKANDMAFELAARGHAVTVLAPIPDYPQGRYYDGYGIFKRRHEKINGVEVIRTLVTPRRNGSAKWLIPNYFTHTLFSSLRGLWLGLRRRFDVVLVHETSPVMIGIPGMIVKRLQKIPMLFWVLDLWPESVSAASGIKNKWIIGALGRLTNKLYRHSDRILISSKGFRKSINRMGDYDRRIEYFPNWVDAALADSGNRVDIPNFPEGFNVLFAGNIGDAQDMPHILEAAKELKGEGINLIFVGDGRKRPWAEEYVREHGLDNVCFLGRFPLEAMPRFFEKADLLLLALKDEPIFKLTVPAKLQAYMSAGKPVIAMMNGEGADVVREAECGWSVEAENSHALAEQLRKIAALPESELRRYGNNGKRYCEENYTLGKCMDHLEELLKNSIGG
ncbi:MAG: glycosyltransferase family 4 protein [Clostridia bacterium]|nr:glycosyltransferase family 4 protein [Clostridia bacterium]